MKLLFGVLILAASAHAQLDTRIPQMSCDNGGNYDRNRQRFCEVREQTIPGVGRLTVDPGKNGGVTVKGWLRNDVSIRSRVETWAPSAGEAGTLAGLVRVDASAGQIKASGPDLQRDSSWSVSYEIFIPQNSDLSMTSFNGSINVSDVRGRIEFDAKNGGVRLTRVAGDVRGQTSNGGIHVELSGSTWEGGQLDARTTNGSVIVGVPEKYSAHIQAETVNGVFDSDFPLSVNVNGRPRPRTLDFSVGSGGPVVHVSTTNGNVKFQRI
jgi:DUF4097 and DUF4098 domain-containing protein YvlB